jgi:hypothetical protein
MLVFTIALVIVFVVLASILAVICLSEEGFCICDDIF